MVGFARRGEGAMRNVFVRSGWAMGVAAVLAAGLMMGCEKSSDDDDNEENGEVAESAFQRVRPSGLTLVNKLNVAGRGTVYEVRCNAINGAVRYHFTTSFGQSETSAMPETAFLKAGPDDPFTLSVFATNAAGERTRTVSRVLNN